MFMYRMVVAQAKTGIPAPNFIYNEMFRKDYKSRYVNTCYPVRDGQFIIAGLNIVVPVGHGSIL